MVRFFSERHAARPLGELDLDPPTIVSLGIVNGGGGRQELKAEHSGGKCYPPSARRAFDDAI